MTANKVSEITVDDVAEYIRIEETSEDDQNTIRTMITVAKSYMTAFTGKKEAELDEYPDFVIALLVLCQDMWDNRTMYVDRGSANIVVDNILSLHSVNLL